MSQLVSWDRNDLTGVDNSSRDEDSEPAHHVALGEEPAGPVTDDDVLLILDHHHDDLCADEGDERRGDVALSKQVPPDVNSASSSERSEEHRLRWLQRWSAFCVNCHQRSLSARLMKLLVGQRSRCLRRPTLCFPSKGVRILF